MSTLSEDYAALRERVGAVELARDVVTVSGPEAAGWLQGQLSQDVEALAAGDAALSLLLEPQGKLVAFLRVTRLADDRFLLDVDTGHGGAVVARLQRFKLRTRAEVEPCEGWRCIALRGPDAPAAAAGGAAEVRAVFPWPGLEGVDLLGPSAAVPPGVASCGHAAWEAVRIEAGLPVMGRELDERTIAAEAGLVGPAASFTKGCYTGQELVARIDARGSNTPRRLRGLLVDGDTPVPAGAAVHAGDKPVGAVTSAALSPARGAVALAFVRREVEPPAPVVLRWDGGERRATVEALPLTGAGRP